MSATNDNPESETNAAPRPAEPRMCPNCGTLGEEAYCPKDGTPTIRVSPLRKHPRSYEAGDVIGGRYRVTGALGAGGFAAVFSAQHTLTEQPVAVKLLAIDPGDVSSRVTVRRFFREAQVTAALASPNTVRVFDVGQDEEGALYIAMELMRGESLEGLLKRRLKAEEPLSEAEAIDLALPMLDSLAEAHAKGLVHRDLKPANIFLAETTDGERTVKVLDFGIARTSDSSLTLGGSIPGTPPFMSPEQCRGEEVDGRSDLYAIAVILYLSTTAKLPFYHQNVLKLMRMHAFDPAPDPRTMTSRPLSEGFARVLMRCLAKQSTERPRSAETLRDELLSVREGTWTASTWDSVTAGSETVTDPASPGIWGSFDGDDATGDHSGIIPLPDRIPTAPGGALDSLQATLAAAPKVRGASGIAPPMELAPGSSAGPKLADASPAAPGEAVGPGEPARAAMIPPQAGSAASDTVAAIDAAPAVAAPSEVVATGSGVRADGVIAAIIVLALVAITAWWFGRAQDPAKPLAAPAAAVEPPADAGQLSDAATSPAVPDPATQAASLARAAQAEPNLLRRLAFAREAASLQPDNAEFAALVAAAEAALAKADVAVDAPALPAAASPTSQGVPAADSAPAAPLVAPAQPANPVAPAVVPPAPKLRQPTMPSPTPSAKPKAGDPSTIAPQFMD